MKSPFTITSITVAGHPTRRDSTVLFKSGLNVICGPSNSGKSWVLHCIDYMFGSSAQDFSLKESDGYTYVAMTVKTDRGRITLRRPIGSGHNDVEVNSTDERVQSGSYKCGKASTNSLPLSHVWLKLIGFDDPENLKVIKNKDYLGASLTWRTFSHVLFADESAIIKSESILLPAQNTGATSFKSALSVLLTGRDFSAEISDVSPEVKKQANNAVIAYLETRPDDLLSRINLIDRTLGADNSDDIHDEIDAVSSEIAQVQDSLRNATSEGRRIALDLQKVRERIAESDMLKRRYTELASSYQARLHRFDFVVEGLELTDRYPMPMICPVCDQVLPADVQPLVAHPGKEERDLLQVKLDDLRRTIREMDESGLQNAEYERELVSRSNAVSELIENKLLPRLNALKGKMDDHNALIVMQTERNHLENELKAVRAEIERRKAIAFPKGEFDPFDYYPEDFWDVMSEKLLNALGSCAFPHLKKAEMNRKSFDAVINDKVKSREGKGYRSFVNTVVLLVLHEYLASECAAHNPGILMIDTPLLGLDDPQQDPELREMRETIPAALYDYLTGETRIGQMIIVDNTKFMPDMTPLANRCNIIRFTKQEDNGRYGFLLDATDGDFTDAQEIEADMTDHEEEVEQ